MDRQQFVHEPVGEHELGVGQHLPQHVMLIDRQMVAMPGIDLEQTDPPPIKLELPDALGHHLGVAPAPALADI